MARVTAGEMRAIRESSGTKVQKDKVLPVKAKSERDQLFIDLKIKGINHKGNMSNIKLKELLEEGDK